MRILRLRAYCEPELAAGSHLTKDMDEAYALHGMTNINYTPMPTRGVNDEVRKAYKNKKHEVLYDGHVIINRFPMVKERRNPIQRAFRYFCCSVCEYYLGVHEKNIDVVHAASTPPTQGMLSALVAKRLSKKYKCHVPFVYNLQDVFPDSLVNAGMTKKGSLVWKIGRKIEDYTYRNADRIIVISEGFKKNIMEKGVPEDKIVVISNWVDLSVVRPVDIDKNTLFDEFIIERSKFVVLYAGNLGEAQGADVIIDAAKELDSYENIQFVIFGGGAKRQELLKRVEEEGVSNVFITSLQPQERVSEVYSMGNVALITCKPGTGNAGMPSKTWSIMACNTPIIASFDVDSDLSEVLADSGAGKCVEPGNSKVLAEAIISVYSDWKRENTKHNNLRDYAMMNASKEVCVQKYIDSLMYVTKHVEG